MKHFSVAFKPDGKRVTIHCGATILEAACRAGIPLNTVCGRQGTCGKCKVELEPDHREVLACQYKIESDITVIIPQTSRFFEQKILKHGTGRQFLKSIPENAKTLKQDDTTDKLFGLAIDIGTTTIVSKLIDLTNGDCVATAAASNPQSIHGDDVISRIAYADSKQKLTELHQLIIDCINKLTGQLCAEARINSQHIYEAVVVGNTTMNHIFLQFPIEQLGRVPYKANSVEAHDQPAGDIALNINPAANIHTVENIAGFVGSDITAVALAADMASAEKITLAVDIGTNGEIVLGTAQKLYAASCAAGPALEGAKITQGSRAVTGAIQRLLVNDNDIDLDIIGADVPRTICGSGLIDAVAELLNLGIIDTTGRFIPANSLEGKLPPAIHKRIIKDKAGPAFVLAWNRDNGGKTVILTQQDIREVQLAKGAIRAGITILLRKMGIDDSQVEKIYLAGAFGNYIRPESALRIDLLPQVPLERIHFVGNAAISGAEMVLLNTDYRNLAGTLARKIEHIEIANEPDFQTIFADSMRF